MRFQATYRNIWGVSFPIIVAGVSETIVEVTDTIFLARYGVTELAAIGLADAVFGLSLFLTAGIVDGLQIIIGRRAGQNRPHEIGAVFNQALYLLTIAAIVLIVGIKLGLPLVAPLVLSSEAVQTAVNSYLQIFSFAILFHSFNLAYSAFYVGVSRTRVLIGATVLLAVTNIVLDYALIFGNFGLPRLGIEGAAIASLVAEIGAFLFLTVDVIRRRHTASYGLFRFGRWNQRLSGRLASISWPVSLEALVETGRWLVFFLIIEQLGETVLAQANVIFACYSILLIPTDGFSETVCSMVSNLIGQETSRRIRILMRKTISLGFLVVTPLALFAIVFPRLVLSLFTTDPEIVEGCVMGLRVVAVTALLVIPADTYGSAVAGTGDTPAAFAIEVVLTVCMLAYAYAAATLLELPLAGIWLAEGIGWGVGLVLSYSWLRSGRWKRLTI